MKKRINIIFGIICYLIATILIGYYLILEFSILNLTSPLERIKIILYIIVIMYLGSLLLNKSDQNKAKVLPKINMWIWFALYIVMLLNLTLFDEYFGRTGIAMISNNTSTIRKYLTENFNIVPFATINNYIIALKNHNLTITSFIYNIFGNLLAFSPFAFFLPRLFKSIDKIYKFIILTSIFIISIETLQMFTQSGSFDIDDYILNILGSLIVYFIINCKLLKEKIDYFIYQKYLIKD